MWIQVELITPLGTYKSRRERVSDQEYADSIIGLKSAIKGEVDAFEMLVADGDADDDIVILGKHVLVNSVFHVVVEK